MVPTVSIIVSLYNKEKWIGECVNSILSQSYRDFELIIINDGSTDSSSGAIPRGDDRLQIIHTMNHGASSARNTGLAQARGRWVMFVDGDDYLEDNALEKLMTVSGGVDLVLGSFAKSGAMKTVVTAEDQILDSNGIAEYVIDNLYDPSKHQMLNGCWAKLFRRSIITERQIHFPVFMRTAEDMGFNYTFLSYAGKVRFLSQVVYVNRKHGDYHSLSTRFNPADPYSLFGFVIGLSYVRHFLRGFLNESEIDHAIGSSYIYHMILYFVRICGQASLRKSYNIIATTIRQTEFMRRLKFYDPAKGNYILIPRLLRLGWVWPVVLACRLKAIRAYGW